MGSDLQFRLGITYNALTNNIDLVGELVPNLLSNRRLPGREVRTAPAPIAKSIF